MKLNHAMVTDLCTRRGFRKPRDDGQSRNRTLTVWVSDGDLANIDSAAKRNRLSRANFCAKCIIAGYRALRASGDMK